jgi:hypothetical protein
MAELAALNVKISGDSGGLVAAVNSAEGSLTSFGRVTTAAEANARGFDRSLRNTGGAATSLQQRINSLTGVIGQSRRSAEASARAFDGLSNEALQSASQMAAAARQAQAYGTQATGASFQTANLAAQFNDIGVMLAAGQSPLMLALQQGTQINQVFSQMGTGASRLRILGAALMSVVSPANLATIGVIAAGAAIVQFGMRALGAGEDAKTYTDALDELESITNDVKRASDILDTSMYDLTARYGDAAVRVRELAVAELQLAVARQRAAVMQAAQNDELQNAISDYSRLTKVVGEMGEVFYDTSSSARAIERDLGVSGQTASELAVSFNALQNALTVEDQVAAWTRIQELLDQAGVSLTELPPELAAALSQVLALEGATIDLEAALNNAAEAGANLSRSLPMTTGGIGPGLFNADGSIAMPPGAPGEGEAPSVLGGGGNLADRIERDLERLREGFMSEEELQIAAYASQQEILQSALEQRLITQQEYNDLMQQAQMGHNDAMAAIDAYRYGSGVQQTQQFMGDMANALRNGNDKMAQISRVFAAGEALINAWRGYSQVLADPTLPFFAKIPAALSVLSAGIGAVNAIKSASGSGGGGGAASAGAAASAASSAPNVSRNVAISLTGGDMFSRSQVVQLINSINEAVEDGAVVRLV